MPKCDLQDHYDGQSDPMAAGGAQDVASSGNDAAPQPRTRGNFVGFIPDPIVNQLRDSAASGAGLALMEAPPTSGGNKAFWVAIAVIGLIAANR